MEKSNLFSGDSNHVFGLDLGTTNSVVSVASKGIPKTLKSHSGETTPSVVRFNEDGTYTIGREAYMERYKENVVYSFKKYMGSNRKSYGHTSRQISTIFVKELINEIKELNPEYKNYNDIQVSVPAYFDSNQRADTKLAIEEAGFKVVGISDEPISAALIYREVKKFKGNVLVFDLGGGTFDAVLMRIIDGIPIKTVDFYREIGVVVPLKEEALEVIEITGDNRLGGDDIDEEMVRLYLKEYPHKPTTEEKEILLLSAEYVKIHGQNSKPQGFDNEMTFAIARQATATIIKRCINIIQPMVDKVGTNTINVVLCGGSTKAAIVQDELAKHFPISSEIDPDLSVSKGNVEKVSVDMRNSGKSIINRLAKGIGVYAGSRVEYLAKKGDILPFNKSFIARNSTPFSKTLDIDLYQGDRITGKNTKVSTIELSGLTNHDETGYLDVEIKLIITSDGEITVEVSAGEVIAKTVLSVSSFAGKEEEGALEVHPKAKYYHRFFKSLSGSDAVTLSLLDEYRRSGNKDVAKQLFTQMSKDSK